MARWPDPAHNQEGSAAQQAYGQSFSQHSIRLGRSISNGEINDLAALWRCCADWRHAKAVEAKDEDATEFTESRTGDTHDLVTPMSHMYAYVHRRAVDSMAEKHPDIDQRVAASSPYPALKLPAGAQMLRLQCTLTLDGQRLGLTEMNLAAEPKTGAPRQLGSDNPDMDGRIGVMIHTRPNNIAPVMAHAAQVFQATLKPGLSRDQRTAGLAEIHWLLAQACPDARGSAAKAELAVRSMAHAMGMELPPFRRGIVADLEAFVTPKDTFIRNYGRMFESSPPNTASHSGAVTM